MKNSIKREKKEFTHSSERENFRPKGKTKEIKTKRLMTSVFWMCF